MRILKTNIIRTFIVLELLSLGFSWAVLAAPSQSEQNSCGPNSVPDWKMIWQDDFAHAGQPDEQKWLLESGGDFGNGDEDEFYTDRLQNLRVENHRLTIEALKEDFKDKHYTSGRMISKQSWQYGRFEFRAKLPIGEGTWPAVWMLPDHQTYGGGEDWWLNNGEIDILEAAGRDPNVNLASAHTQKFNFAVGTQNTTAITVPNGQSEFHTYALEWYPDHLDFFLDGNKYHSYRPPSNTSWKEWPFNQKFHFVVNLAVGGGFGGEISNDSLPARFEIEYFRVYRFGKCSSK